MTELAERILDREVEVTMTVEVAMVAAGALDFMRGLVAVPEAGEESVAMALLDQARERLNEGMTKSLLSDGIDMDDLGRILPEMQDVLEILRRPNT